MTARRLLCLAALLLSVAASAPASALATLLVAVGPDFPATVMVAQTSPSTSLFKATPPGPVITPAIYLGYADNYHDAAGSPIPPTPSPWAGDANIVFVGCTTEAECGKLDGGAIRVDNPAGNPALTLIDAYVDIGPCHFAPWVALLPVTAQPGQSIVLTQTGLLGPPMPAPCREAMDPLDWPLQNFDTSERPGDTRSPPFYNCDLTTGLTPVIKLVFDNGMSLTVTDAGKVLNTGGADSHTCFGVNEATPWTAVDPANVARVQLGVTFRSLTASRTRRGVSVRWRTASETQMLGFHVFRQVNAKRVRANTNLIAAKGKGSYSFLDRKAPRGKVARYWVQVVNRDGSRSWYGPVVVRALR